MDNYVVSSLELHLFFARIMKEHALFLAAGYTQANSGYAREAVQFQEAFEDLLMEVVYCSEGVVGPRIFSAGEVITEYTFGAEKKTSMLTGADINQKISIFERELWNKCRMQNRDIDSGLREKIKEMNRRCLRLLREFILFKEQTLQKVLDCKMFTMNYPLLLEHIIREAKLYEKYVKGFEAGIQNVQGTMREVELFWNQIMMEHALFIRGLLDPTESELIMAADDFARQFAKLLLAARDMTARTMTGVTNTTIEQTEKYRDFKTAGVKGILECDIRSLILPLLADHVLREANHYLRILEEK